ncbi:OmpA/MotB domain-containing protein [Methylopila jiangsuensis]|uniref:OmpA/MotB domain-containing protein n=1 Tax=Methylopila jiangsuensis TaxID=586230 RepID=A0A9W6JFN3_9HYPH|nr:OmpA family protein [Methylopila jiangsuensis]MDR6285803.1 outer membrane protein OmpA-like peptidoglycan-associated protein [Methylopila jiangsuensis]GLK75561.1 OmpA/MotB domain-containing protein [Methylopila jiangsuensis]
MTLKTIPPRRSRRSLLAGGLLGFAVAAGAPAAAKDVAGGKDHPLVGRYDGATLQLYKAKDYEEQRLLTKRITGADIRAAGGRRLSDANAIKVAGKAFRLKYSGPKGRSALEVARNLQDGLKAKGFEILFQCRAAECSDLNGGELYFALNDESPMGRGDIRSGVPDVLYASAVLRRPEGDVYAGVYVGQFGDTPETLVDVVETRPMEAEKIVFVDASAMQQAIEADGRVALYGVLFDFDKATLRSDAKPTMDEIGKLLTANPALKVVVAGHTDADGAFDYNVDLSKRRAASVVATLVKRYGVAPARLKSFGVGMASPVATNDTDAGRAKNRRVELVKAAE